MFIDTDTLASPRRVLTKLVLHSSECRVSTKLLLQVSSENVDRIHPNVER
jgi:hypothetical protein